MAPQASTRISAWLDRVGNTVHLLIRRCARLCGVGTRRSWCRHMASPTTVRPSSSPPRLISGPQHGCGPLQYSMISKVSTPWHTPAPWHFAGISGEYQDLGNKPIIGQNCVAVLRLAWPGILVSPLSLILGTGIFLGSGFRFRHGIHIQRVRVD